MSFMEKLLLNNLKKIKDYNPLISQWDNFDWAFYFIAIPAILVIIFILPSEIRYHFILDL